MSMGGRPTGKCPVHSLIEERVDTSVFDEKCRNAEADV